MPKNKTIIEKDDDLDTLVEILKRENEILRSQIDHPLTLAQMNYYGNPHMVKATEEQNERLTKENIELRKEYGPFIQYKHHFKSAQHMAKIIEGSRWLDRLIEKINSDENIKSAWDEFCAFYNICA